MTKRCIGCGVTLQCEDKEKLGYIKEEKINDSKYCQRCFRMMHYNENSVVALPKDQKYILNSVNKTDNYVFFLVDFFNLNLEIIKTFKAIKNNKTLIISKMDLIPKSFNFNKIVEWLKNTYKINNEIIFLSAKKNFNTKKLFSILDENNKKSCYVMGYTNAGKSTLINALKNDNKNTINTSLIPNTTLDFINIYIDEYIFTDSPGFVLNENIYLNNELDFIKKISPKKFIKPGSYQLKKNSSILIENKVRVTNLDDINTFTFYMSNDLNLQKVFENNDRLMEYSLKTYHIKKNTDVVIKGIGFINIKKECDINIYIQNHDLIELRKSFLGSEYYE